MISYLGLLVFSLLCVYLARDYTVCKKRKREVYRSLSEFFLYIKEAFLRSPMPKEELVLGFHSKDTEVSKFIARLSANKESGLSGQLLPSLNPVDREIAEEFILNFGRASAETECERIATASDYFSSQSAIVEKETTRAVKTAWVLAATIVFSVAIIVI